MSRHLGQLQARTSLRGRHLTRPSDSHVWLVKQAKTARLDIQTGGCPRDSYCARYTCADDIPAAETSWATGWEVPFCRASRKLSAIALLSIAGARFTACYQSLTSGH